MKEGSLNRDEKRLEYKPNVQYKLVPPTWLAPRWLTFPLWSRVHEFPCELFLVKEVSLIKTYEMVFYQATEGKLGLRNAEGRLRWEQRRSVLDRGR